MANTGLAHRGKRWLYLIHRWVGIAACLLFLFWFLSGLVMVYMPFPALTSAERLAGLPAIDWPAVRIGPDAAERIASPDAPARAIVLEMSAAEPVWRVTPALGTQITISAKSGNRITRFDADGAARIASAFGRAQVVAVETLIRDQWTVAGGFDAHRPLFRARLAGPERRDLYVSSTTGAVVLDTNGSERFWNWLGSVPHWIYPTILRQNNAAWRQVVMWVSGPCILVALTGIWIGILRTRIGERRFPQRRMTPYHGWMLWHHVAGLAGGITLTLWIFSGWLSVDPFRFFNGGPGLSAEALARYNGATALPTVDVEHLAAVTGDSVKRVEIIWAAGRAWAVAAGTGFTSSLDLRTLVPARVAGETLIAAAAQLSPRARIAGVETLFAPDAYWYALATLPQLPVLRVIFDDAVGTWVHIDPVTGRLLGSVDQRGRAYRWVYDLFHKWDLNVLMLNRPVWDVILWLLSLVGIITSLSGVWIGWKRVRRPAQHRSIEASRRATV